MCKELSILNTRKTNSLNKTSAKYLNRFLIKADMQMAGIT